MAARSWIPLLALLAGGGASPCVAQPAHPVDVVISSAGNATVASEDK